MLQIRKDRAFGVASIIAIGALNFGDQFALTPNYTLIEKEFGISHAEMGLVGSCFMSTFAISLLIFGYLADKYSRKKLLLTGTTIWSVLSIATYFVTSYNQLLVVRTVGGIGMGCLMPIAYSMIADWYPPKERGKVFGWFGVILGAGGGIFTTLAAFTGTSLGWRYIFKWIGIIGIILVVILIFFLKDPKKGEIEPEFKKLVEEGIFEYKYTITWKDVKEIFKKHSNVYIILQSIPGCIPWGAIGVWGLQYLVLEQGMIIPVASTFFGIMGIGSAIGSIVAGYVGDWVDKHYGASKRLALVQMCILAGMLTLIIMLRIDLPKFPMSSFKLLSINDWILFYRVLFTNWKFVMVCVLYSISMFFHAFSGPNMYAIVQDVNLPEVRGTVNALNNLTDYGGKAIGPYIGGLLAMNFGTLRNALTFSSLFWIPCVVIYSAAIFTIDKDEKKTREILRKRAEEKF